MNNKVILKALDEMVLEKQGQPPRPGLVFDRTKHRWVRPADVSQRSKGIVLGKRDFHAAFRASETIYDKEKQQLGMSLEERIMQPLMRGKR